MKPRYRFTIQTKYPPRHALVGSYAGLARGTGYDFWGLRKYVRGDSYAHIDWKARARTGELHVREFLRDSAYNLVLLCDVSPSMRFGRKYATMTAVAGSLAHAALREGNPTGLVLFDDRVRRFLSPSAEPRQHHRIVHALETPAAAPGQHTALGPGLELVKRRLPSCLGVILSDFLCDLGEVDRFGEAASTDRVPAHEIVAVHVLEEVERTGGRLPAGSAVAQDVESCQRMVLDVSERSGLAVGLGDRLEERVQQLAKAGIDSVVLQAGNGDVQERINTFFARRARARV